MIVCLSPSPAIDVTYRLAQLRLDRTNRIESMHQRAGGKAVNVARVLGRLGEPCTVLLPAGAADAAWFDEELRELGIDVLCVTTRQAVRRTVTLLSDHPQQTTVLAEPARIGGCWTDFLARSQTLIQQASVVVASGSLPVDAPVDGYAQLVCLARAHATPIIVDTSGPALRAAMAAGPTISKPNAEELTEATGIDDPLTAAKSLTAGTGSAVVVSLGPGGMLAVTPDAAWSVTPVRPLTGNPTGAGDAAVAALARGLAAGSDWPTMLADATALSGLAVLAPHAGQVDLTRYQEVRPPTVEKMETAT